LYGITTGFSITWHSIIFVVQQREERTDGAEAICHPTIGIDSLLTTEIGMAKVSPNVAISGGNGKV